MLDLLCLKIFFQSVFFVLKPFHDYFELLFASHNFIYFFLEFFDFLLHFLILQGGCIFLFIDMDRRTTSSLLNDIFSDDFFLFDKKTTKITWITGTCLMISTIFSTSMGFSTTTVSISFLITTLVFKYLIFSFFFLIIL